MTEFASKHPTEVEEGDIVQITEKNHYLRGLLCVVTEKKVWGIQAEIWESHGKIPIRLEWGDYLYAGHVPHPGPEE
ncbi:MAG: hypothetical protein AB7V18_19300 [Pyrinomonadaceae bacterium]